MSELPAKPSQITDHEITEAKNAALLPLLEQMAKELLERQESGQLAGEIKGYSTEKLANMLAKLASALKGPAVQIGVNLPAPVDPQKLRSGSVMQLTDEQKKRLRLRHKKAIEAEVVKPEDKRA